MQGYDLYNLAACITAMCFSKRPPSPEEAFPNMIPRRVMSGDEIYQNCLAWVAALGGNDNGNRDESWTAE